MFPERMLNYEKPSHFFLDKVFTQVFVINCPDLVDGFLPARGSGPGAFFPCGD
jgi:hypothetical protein